VFAQQVDIYKRKPWEDVKNKWLHEQRLSFDKIKENKTAVSDTIFDRSVVKIQLKRKYLSNNGQGADIYAMMPYNMPCLVPDSTYSSNMPVTNLNKKSLN
jgi:hypothetical protein